jgi:hypothetical protein
MEAAGIAATTPCLICVSEAGRQIFLAISERLRWEATYRVEGYSFADYDTLQDFVEDTIGALSVADCSEIVNNITTVITNNVTNNITQAVQDIQAYQDACCYLDAGQPALPPDPSAEPSPGNSGERDELCIQAQVGHDGVTEFLNQVFEYASFGAGLTAAIIALFLGGILLPLVLVAIVIGAIVAFVANDQTEEVLGAWQDAKHDLVCAIVNATSATAAKNDVDAYIDGMAVSEAIKTFFKVLWSQAAINQMWDKELVVPGGYSADYCNDCSEWTNVGGIAVTVVSKDGTKCAWAGGVGNFQWMNCVLDQENPAPPVVFCFVADGLGAHQIGDENCTTGFDQTPNGEQISLGVSTCGTGSGNMQATFSDFKILVSTSENPGAWFWVDAIVTRSQPDTAGKFEVTEGIGSAASVWVNESFGGAGTYGENITISVPPQE